MALLDILKKKKTKEKTIAALKGDRVSATDAPRQVSINEKPKQKQKSPKMAAVTKSTPKEKGEHFSHVILRPRITEKASAQSGGNSYTFEVARNANKIDVKKAVREIYSVEPTKINIVHVKPKQKLVRNRKGKTASFKKAVVFLKEGDSIEFV